MGKSKYSYENEYEYEYEENIDGLLLAIRDGKKEIFHRLKKQLMNNGFFVSPSQEGWLEILNKFSESKISNKEILSILDLFSKDSIVECLAKNPEVKGYETFFRKLDQESLEKLLPQIDDLTKVKYVAKNRDISVYFDNIVRQSIQDEYLRDTERKAVLSERFDFDKEIANAEDYIEMRNVIAQAEEKERYIMIMSLEPKDETRESIDELNKRKISLLDYIHDPEMRETIIATLTPNIDPLLKDDVDSAKSMILKFLSSNGELTQEMREKVDIVFNSYSIQYADLSKAGNNGSTLFGRCFKAERKIEMHDSIEDSNQFIATVIHELGHALSGMDILDQYNNLFLSESARANSLEEGMVETFTQLVLDTNEYNVETNIYQGFSAISKTLLSSLRQGEDVEAVKEYMLGSKSSFYGAFPEVNLFKDVDTTISLTPSIIKGLAKRHTEFNDNQREVYSNSNHILDSGILTCNDRILLKKMADRINSQFDSTGNECGNLEDAVRQVNTDLSAIEEAEEMLAIDIEDFLRIDNGEGEI